MENTEQTMQQEEKKTFKDLWMEKPWIRTVALILAISMLFGLAGHGIYMHLLNRAYAIETEEQAQVQKAMEARQDAYGKAFQEAADAAQSGDYAVAVEKISQCLDFTEEGSREQIDLLTTRASLNILLGNNEQALPDLQKVTQAAPGSQDVLLLKSQTELGNQDYDAALADMERYLELNPENYEIRLTATQLYETLGRYQQSAESYEKLLSLRPGDMVLKLNTARAEILAENTDKALELLNTVSEKGNEGEQKNAYFLTALAHMQGQNFTEAIASYEQAMAAGYDPMVCLEQMCSCAFVLGDYQKVLQCDTDVNQISPEGSEDAAFYQQVGVAAMALEQYDLGIQKISRSLELNPDYEGSAYYRGLCHFSLGNWEEAIEDFTKSVDQGYLMQNCYYNRGLCHAQLLDYNKALQDMERTVSYDGDQELTKSAEELMPSLKEAIQEKK